MVESLKELSDASPAGPWDLSPQELDDWGVIRAAHDATIGFRPVVITVRGRDDETEVHAARREHRQPRSILAIGSFIVALVNAYRSGQLHDATALAEAEARGRRQGLEEAAQEALHRARAMRMTGIPSEINDIRANAVMTVALALDVLATAPAETQKPETGESAHAALEGGEQP